ncbi:MAG: ribosome hibernation-promoting factor, HPF/YfiA family [Candidatus Geothermincolia bacterium]
MQMIVKGKNIEITSALRDYTEEKVGKVGRYFDRIIKTEVVLSVEKNPKISESQVVEVTIHSAGPLIRAKESASDMYQAIDLVTDKLERRVKRMKAKVIDRAHGNSHRAAVAPAPVDEFEGEEEPRIVRTKSFNLKPMTPEEAALQMDLLGHSFYVFINAETGDGNVVYKRRDGNYGLIEPE